MHYTFNQLRIYRSVVENQSVTKAAEELHMTQPAVSVQLRNLQDQFDIPLTEVIGRQLYVTEFGREVYEMSMVILQQVDAINYRAQSFHGLLSGKLRITVASTGKYVMPYYLKEFLKAHPAIDLLMDVTNKSKVIDSLEKNEVDFSLVSVMPDHLDLQQEVLLPHMLYLAGAPDSKISTTRKANKSVFDKLPLIFREEGSGTRALMQQYFKKADIVPKVRMELTSNEAVKQAVMAGLGYSVLSILSMKNELKLGEISIIPVRELPLTENWRLVWRSAKKMSVIAAAFLEHIRSNKQKIYATHFSWMEKY